MGSANTDHRGTITKERNVWSIDRGLVEEVSSCSGRSGYMIVSYAIKGQNNMTKIELLRLNINANTLIRNQMNQPVCLCDIRPGMWIDAECAPFMSHSVPPQTTALRIVVKRDMHQKPPAGVTKVDRIVSVDTRNSFFITGNPNNINQQMRFVVTKETVILNQNGMRIQLCALHHGQRVEVTHADFMTMSIPPQTTAFRVQVL